MNRRTLFLISVFSLAALATRSVAQDFPSPWEGEISGNDVNVRSGEGTRYYATGKLDAGDRVLVLGESNGWYKILPPDGSFSYIDKAAVERHTNDIGSVSREKAYVRAGSHVSRRKSRTQVILGKGDPVVILGEADGFYKIEPPKRASLFVAKQFVNPVADGKDAGLVKRYSAADWKKAGDSASDSEAAQTPDLPDTPESDAGAVATINPAQPTNPTQFEPRIAAPTTDARPIETPVRNDVRQSPTIQANRPIETNTGATDSTLVLTANNGTNATTTDAPTYDSSHRDDVDSNSTLVVNEFTQPRPANDRYRIEYSDSQQSDLTPADRRPPADIPDWARDNDSNRNTASRVAVQSTTSERRDTTDDRPDETRGDDLNRQAAYRSENASRSTIGTMVEITPGAGHAPVASNWRAPETVRANPPATIGTTQSNGTNIVAYARPDTLTLNASSTTSNTPVAANTPTTIVDSSNSFPAEDSSRYRETYASSSTTEYSINDTTAYVQPTTQTDFQYPAPSSPPPQIPIDPNSGPYAAKLVQIETDLHAIMDLPVERRPYPQLIERYNEIAVQSSERVPSEYATIRIEQVKGLERVRRLAVRYASDRQGLQHFSRRMDEERSEIRNAQTRVTGGGVGGAFEYEGTLMRSYAFAPEKRRYRLVDPGTQSTIIYVDIPVDVAANPDTLTGKSVGIRIRSRQYSDAAQIPIVEAADVVDLSTPNTKYRSIPAPQVRNSGDFSNPANTHVHNPNPLMNEPIARERSGSGTMDEVERTES